MNTSTYYIDVILPIPVVQLFTYSINEEEAKFLKPGFRVAVPFGKSKITTALVYSVHRQPPTVYQAKEIYQILDETPVVSKLQLQHWEWIAQYYMCALGEVMKAAMPTSFLLSSETILSLKRAVAASEKLELSAESVLIIEALELHTELSVNELSKITQKKHSLRYLNELLEAKLVTTREEIFEQYKPKKIRYVKLHPQYKQEAALAEMLNTLQRAKKQHEVMLTYFMLSAKQDNISVKALKEASGASSQC